MSTPLGKFLSIQYYIYSHQLYSSYRTFDLDCFTILSTILICFSHEKIHVLLISNCFISQMDRINLMNLKGY